MAPLQVTLNYVSIANMRGMSRGKGKHDCLSFFKSTYKDPCVHLRILHKTSYILDVQ